MLMKPEKKNMAALIIGASNPKSKMDEMKSANESMSEAPEMDPGLQAAAEEMLSAFESKDASALAEAMKSFIEMCDEPEAPASEAPQE